jgi:uncharacterized protein YigA (DUF484 family)
MENSQGESQIGMLDHLLEMADNLLDRQDKVFEDNAKRFKGKNFGALALLRVKSRDGELTLDRLVAEQLKIDDERIDRAIASAVRKCRNF